MKKIAASLAVAAAALALSVVALASPADPPTLIFNHQISSIWIGESYARVTYNWGGGKNVGCVLMFENPKSCAVSGIQARYRAPSGAAIFVGFYGNRVVYISTTSSYYATSDGLAVGSSIPYNANGVVLDGTKFRWIPSIAVWIGWSKQPPREPRNARWSPKPNKAYRRWVAKTKGTTQTVLSVDHGSIVGVIIARGDVNLQL